MSQSLRQPLTNLQIELLELYAHHASDEELREIKQLMGEYYARKAIALADQIWEEKGLTQDVMEDWSKEHMRTPYKAQQEYLEKKKKS
jgi:hypothetical protein